MRDFSDIREGVEAICSRFGDEYWLARDEDGVFPQDFHAALAEAESGGDDAHHGDAAEHH